MKCRYAQATIWCAAFCLTMLGAVPHALAYKVYITDTAGNPAGQDSQDNPGSPDEDSHNVITTDTQAYCLDLQRLVSMHETRQPEVDRLAAQGREMCQRGEVRGGILRLRQAVRLLNADNPIVPR